MFFKDKRRIMVRLLIDSVADRTLLICFISRILSSNEFYKGLKVIQFTILRANYTFFFLSKWGEIISEVALLIKLK